MVKERTPSTGKLDLEGLPRDIVDRIKVYSDMNSAVNPGCAATNKDKTITKPQFHVLTQM